MNTHIKFYNKKINKKIRRKIEIFFPSEFADKLCEEINKIRRKTYPKNQLKNSIIKK